MEQANLEAAQKFQNTNGMTIDEAYQHVKTWHEEGKHSEVIDGCEEIIKYIPDYEDVQNILADAKSKMTEAPATAEETTPQPEATAEAKDPAAPAKKEEYKPSVADDEKIVSAIGYIGFLCVLPLLLKKDSKFCTFHGKQALTLAIIFFLFKFLGILRDMPLIGGLFKFMLGVVMFMELFVIIFAIIQAYRGKQWKIPVVYGMSQKLKF